MRTWTATLVRLAVIVLAAVGAVFLLVALTPLPNLLALPLLQRTVSLPVKADVIVVLSGGRYADGTLNEAALERTVRGVILYREGLAPWLLFTGGPCCGHSASALMSDLAVKLGVPRSAILVEEQSRRTRESAILSASLLRRHGLRSAIVVTSTLHLPRARLAFKNAGVAVHPIRATEKNLRLVTGTAERISLLSDTVHEYAGLLFYHARGWL